MIVRITTPSGYTLKKRVRKTNQSKVVEVTLNPECSVEILLDPPPPEMVQRLPNVPVFPQDMTVREP